MIIQTQQSLSWDMTYHDDPIFEDKNFHIMRNTSLKPGNFTIVRPNSSGSSEPQQNFHIVSKTTSSSKSHDIDTPEEQPKYHIVRPAGSYNTTDTDLNGNEVTYNIVRHEDEPRSNWFKNIIKKFSRYGMNYDGDILRNMYAIPADKDLIPKNENSYGGMESVYAQMMSWKKKSNENQSFFEKDFNQRREVLRKLAQQPELEDILDVMCNECIVYDADNTYICEPYIDRQIVETLNVDSADEIKKCIDKAFYKFYMLLDWKEKAWDEFKRYLIDGILAYEVVYDSIEHPHAVIGIIPLDPATLTKKIEEGITFWYQYEGVQGKERKMYDAQIIYIKYQDSGVVTRLSYLERLIRPFNIYRIVEQAQIIWTVTQASFKTVFTIPVGNQGRARGRQTLNQAMSQYREDIAFDTESGELQVNGKVNQPFNKEYWLMENENGKPQIETLTDNGPDLNDSMQLKYFKNELYKMSKIPGSRFDTENAATWLGTDAQAVLRDEINFSRFVTRVRNNFAQIMLKLLQIQLAIDLPDLKADKRILTAISLRFTSYNQFEELMDIDVMQKRLDFVNAMKDALVDTDSEGNEHKFFSSRFLAEKYLKMSDSDFRLNEKYKEYEVEQAKKHNEKMEKIEPDNVTVTDHNDWQPTDASLGTENLGSDEYQGDSGEQEPEGSGPSDAEQARSDFDIPV